MLAQVQHGGAWNPRPSALRRLGWELARRTSIETASTPASVQLAEPGLHRFPWLYLAGAGALPPFTEPERAALRRHLQYGGFLVVDAGSLLYSKSPIPPHLAAQEELKADLLTSIYQKQLQVAAVGLGPADLAKGTGALRMPRTAVNVADPAVKLQAPNVIDIGIGRGWGRARTKAGDTVDVVSVDDYAIIATVSTAADCPAIPGYGAGLDGATIFFRHV